MQPGIDAFVVFQNKILLLLRDDIVGIQNPNMWNLPGGGIEMGETEQEALFRELKEEINLTPRTIKYLEKTSYPDGNVVTKFWVEIDEDQMQQLTLGEGQKMEFFSLSDLLTLHIIPNLRNYLEVNQEKMIGLLGK